MPFEKFANVETINTERRKAIAKSIRMWCRLLNAKRLGMRTKSLLVSSAH